MVKNQPFRMTKGKMEQVPRPEGRNKLDIFKEQKTGSSVRAQLG